MSVTKQQSETLHAMSKVLLGIAILLMYYGFFSSVPSMEPLYASFTSPSPSSDDNKNIERENIDNGNVGNGNIDKGNINKENINSALQSAKLQRQAQAILDASKHNYTLNYIEQKEWFAQARKRKIPREQFWDEVSERLFPYWYGTEWDCNGTTQVPGSGAIACGYLLTTILRDAGLKIPRVKLAQMASGEMIKRLVGKKHIKYFLNMSHTDFIAKMKGWGKGLYMIGMDNHTGFLWHDGQELYFVHSSIFPFKNTRRELALWSPVLASTAYRVVGKISADRTVHRDWLAGRKFGRSVKR